MTLVTAVVGSDDKPSVRQPLQITTLIFDVDDTLYDVGTGFTAHRNGEGAQSFMVAKLSFSSTAEAKVVRDEYFEKYHSTAKALTVAEAEGRLPPAPKDADPGKRRFNPKDLAEWWAQNLDYSLLGGPDPRLVDMMRSCPLQLVAFSNGPRKYVKRVLKQIGMDEFFSDEMLFAVDDVLPHCKPEEAAFRIVLEKVGAKPEECVMIEDSMKNIREAKKLGMKTVLVTGVGRMAGRSSCERDTCSSKADAAEATKRGDAPVEDDPAVDICVEVCSELREALPGLWQQTP